MRNEREEKLSSILGELHIGVCLLGFVTPDIVVAAFATDLEESVRSKNLPSSRASVIYNNIDKLLALPCVSNHPSDLDRKGTKLWNLASKLKKEDASSGELLCLG